MMMTNSEENLVMGGIFGCLIGGLFLAFGGISNFLCEMLFWSVVLYVGVIYFEIVPNFVRDLMKKYSEISYYLRCLAWVPLAVGGAMALFLASLLFIDYGVNELNLLLKTAKFVLLVLVAVVLSVVYVRKTEIIGLAFKS